jgi:PhnB protein
MTTINPWINFNGNAEEAFTFYQSVFGGEFTKMVRFKDLSSDEFPILEAEAEKLMMIELSIDINTILVGNDVPAVLGTVNENENRSKILIRVASKVEADRLFSELSVGGQVEGEMGNSPWGTYAGMFRDQYGIEWLIEYKDT